MLQFRVWDTVKKAMSEVQAIVYAEEKVYPIYFKEIRRYIPFSEAILMQSTGLFDKNGKEIFEGDVLRDSESIVIVKFVDGAFSVDYRNMGGEWRNYGSLFRYLRDFEGEIIGNVYENKELVEELK